jgi:hypothetical protein
MSVGRGAGFSLRVLELARTKILRLHRLRKKRLCFVILSEAKNLSLFLFLYLNRREILRFAQNDRVLIFSAACEACTTCAYLEFAGSRPLFLMAA